MASPIRSGTTTKLLTYGDPPPDLARLAPHTPTASHVTIPLSWEQAHALSFARLFLLLTGTDLVATQEEKYSTFLALAAGQLSEEM